MKKPEGLSPLVKLAALQAMGVPLDRAKMGAGIVEDEEAKPSGEPVEFPIRLTLQWTALCSDNDRERAGLFMVNGTPYPRKVMNARFKQAREKTQKKARDMMAGRHAVLEPLSLVARVYVPDNRIHDVCNFAKGVHDALQDIVYKNDAQLHDSRWIRAGVDPDAPRAELEISLL